MINSKNLPIIQKLLADAISIKNDTVVKMANGKIDEIWFKDERLAYDDAPFIVYKSPYILEHISFDEVEWYVVVDYDYDQNLTLELSKNNNVICFDFEHTIKLTEDYKINIDGLDKSLLEWNEEDLLYYTLKNA